MWIYKQNLCLYQLLNTVCFIKNFYRQWSIFIIFLATLWICAVKTGACYSCIFQWAGFFQNWNFSCKYFDFFWLNMTLSLTRYKVEPKTVQLCNFVNKIVWKLLYSCNNSLSTLYRNVLTVWPINFHQCQSTNLCFTWVCIFPIYFNVIKHDMIFIQKLCCV